MSETGQLTGGQLNAALAERVVQIHNRYVGRGPGKGHAFFRDTIVVVVMQETLTKAEQSLAASGRRDHVLEMRREFQRTMEDDLIEAVEELTGCKVIAFMSDNHIAPDMAAELFVLDRPVPGESEASDGAASPDGSSDGA